jgi:hypothetical protein
MSLIRLQSGGFIAIDTVPLDSELKAEIDQLTDNGKNIIAVVATHPFHTLAFPGFYEAYPDTVYIGTPRHVKTIKSIPWSNVDVMSPEVLTKWEPEIEMRIPDGAEFRAPTPESTNHFSSVWVYHRLSKTIHIDDTVMYFENPGALMKLAGKKQDHMEFHPTIQGPGLLPAPDAAQIFKAWVQKVIYDWDFENIVTAHVGRKLGGAKEALRKTLEDSEKIFEKLEQAHRDNVPISEIKVSDDERDPKDCDKYNVDGNECG